MYIWSDWIEHLCSVDSVPRVSNPDMPWSRCLLSELAVATLAQSLYRCPADQGLKGQCQAIDVTLALGAPIWQKDDVYICTGYIYIYHIYIYHIYIYHIYIPYIYIPLYTIVALPLPSRPRTERAVSGYWCYNGSRSTDLAKGWCIYLYRIDIYIYTIYIYIPLYTIYI